MDLWPVGPVMIDEAETFRFGTFGAAEPVIRVLIVLKSAPLMPPGGNRFQLWTLNRQWTVWTASVDAWDVSGCLSLGPQWRFEPSVDGADCVSGWCGLRQWTSQFGASVEV